MALKIKNLNLMSYKYSFANKMLNFIQKPEL